MPILGWVIGLALRTAGNWSSIGSQSLFIYWWSQTGKRVSPDCSRAHPSRSEWFYGLIATSPFHHWTVWLYHAAQTIVRINANLRQISDCGLLAHRLTIDWWWSRTIRWRMMITQRSHTLGNGKFTICTQLTHEHAIIGQQKITQKKLVRRLLRRNTSIDYVGCWWMQCAHPDCGVGFGTRKSRALSKWFGRKLRLDCVFG